MAMLTWDGTGDRLYETGVDRGVYYAMNDNGSYGNAVAWNGLTGVTESPDGADANDIYADNIKYLSLISKENWKGTIKAYTYPVEFNACMGQAEVPDAFAYFGQQSRTKFGFSWRSLVGNDVKGDKYSYKLHIAYGLSAAPTEMDHATENDSPEAQEFSWEISSIPPTSGTKIYTNGSKAQADEKLLAAVAHITIYKTVGTNNNGALVTAIENRLYGTDDSEPGAEDGTTGSLPDLDVLINFLRSWNGVSGTWTDQQ